jgi:hypothetical protein
MATVSVTGTRPPAPPGFACPSGQTLVPADVSYTATLTDTTDNASTTLSGSRTFFTFKLVDIHIRRYGRQSLPASRSLCVITGFRLGHACLARACVRGCLVGPVIGSARGRVRCAPRAGWRSGAGIAQRAGGRSALIM